MRLGLIARADNSGLGIQTLGFFKHMHPDKTLVIDISGLNGNPVFLDRYPGATVVRGFPDHTDIRTFLQGLDVVFTAETTYSFDFYTIAKEMGVKVANQYNYEFFDWSVRPELPMPDMFIAPSMWHYNDVERFCNRFEVKHQYLHCPTAQMPSAQQPKEFKTFLHMAGRPASHDRNGTETVIRASKLLKSDARIVIHFQGEQGLAHQTTHTTDDYKRYAEEHGDPSRLYIECIEAPDYRDVYTLGDVLVMPRRYGGNCLPMNEGLASGMPVLMTDISPNNEFLPPQWLLPSTLVGQFEPRTLIDIYQADEQKLAEKIDMMANMSQQDVGFHTDMALHLARKISWETMTPKYREALELLCTQS